MGRRVGDDALTVLRLPRLAAGSERGNPYFFAAQSMEAFWANAHLAATIAVLLYRTSSGLVKKGG